MAIQNSLTCPHCNKKIDLSEALSHDLEEVVRQKMQQQFNTKEEVLKAQLQTAEQNFAKKLKAAEDSKNAAIEASELERVKLKASLEKELSKKIEDKFTLEQQDLKNQLAEEKKRSTAAIQKELELRKQQRELEEKQHNLKLEVQRQIDEERKKIAEDTMKQAQAESSQIIEQQNIKMLELQKALDDARRKVTQGSQQTQGEALELLLEDELSKMFPQDDFEAVPKGIKGADLIQRVRSTTGKLAGTILWEFKQTKSWSDEWLHKLKEDQRELSAELAAIVSTTLPKELSQLGTIDNIWITQPGLAKSLAHMLREQVLQVYQARLTNMIPADQKENVFKYLTGTKFKQSIEGEIETVSSLLQELQKEKKAFTKIWASREQQLNQLLSFKAGLYGDLQGILGKSLPAIAHLELADPTDKN